MLFPSGFAANAGTIPALAEEGDAIFSDAKNHASIVDGCRLSKAECHIYPHCDWQALEKLLAASAHRRRLIVTDALFSMDGDLAPLREIGRLAQRYAAMLLVDEAHATGVFGASGQGVVEALAVDAPDLKTVVAVKVGTLSKAVGSAGGFVCGERRLVDWLANRARSYVYSTAQPASASAAALAGLDAIQAEPGRGAQLLKRAGQLRKQLQSAGWNTGNSESQIIPLLIGSADSAMELARRLSEEGFYVPAIRPPSVPDGESLLRISLNHRHTEQQMDNLLEALQRARGGRRSPRRAAPSGALATRGAV